ncbi:Myb/SANT-like DNA-binding domain containing protein 4 [Dissostichus eleginoides]|uniref:Myb/SANT-like DNA-binding domain containing protein 4 n=1 Tax=Dissostichus eleginoides TaxID=100907 RepID=A0AAD9BZS8_DISEL|nr:Myb/SANT-like DNA-binding domain containing protein 4 [Dissostichus eleginoides]
MNTERDLQMRRNERAHFFSSKEQELILKLYEEEREILTAKSNTTTASKQREESWQRIADKINTRQVEVLRNQGEPGTPSLTSAEEDVLQHKDGRLRVEVLPGGAFIEPLTGSESSFISVSGHPVLLLPITKTEPESVSSDETDVSDSQFEGVLHNSSFQEKANSAYATAGGRREARHTEDIRALYCNYLKKEMENRDHQMAYRSLKMRKIEKEMLLLDKQLM